MRENLMAKLVAVCRDKSYPFKERQIPLSIEEELTMVMEIPSPLELANVPIVCVDEREVDRFKERYNHLNSEELYLALTVTKKEVFSLLSSSVQCVGCRRSAERLYNQLWNSKQQSALEPLVFLDFGYLSFEKGCLMYPKFIHGLFYVYSFKLRDIVVSIPTSKRNRRCWLHSLEMHKSKASGWMDLWDVLSQDCRDEMVLIDSDLLMITLEGYLRKHRFCSECKSKVLKAFGILTGDIDGANEKGYCPALYDGLRSCPQDNHIHVLCNTDYIAHLIGRAEPELLGGRRERHARTIDIAQEEVLTCLGIHLWERLHRMWQKLRAEEQTWQILFYYCVEALRKSFEMSVEDKLGVSRLEQVVEEFSEADRVKEARREQKRLKKKRRKENKTTKFEPELEDCDSSSVTKQSFSSSGSEASCSLLVECNDSHTESEASTSPVLNGHTSTIDCDCSSGDECCDDSEEKNILTAVEKRHCESNGNAKHDIDSGQRQRWQCNGPETQTGNENSTCQSKCPTYCGNSNDKLQKGSDHREWNGCHSSQDDVKVDACHCSMKENGRHTAKSRKKQAKQKEKQMKIKGNRDQSMQKGGLFIDEGDDEELRFLKSMGWTCPDSSCFENAIKPNVEPCISEQEIEDFKTKKKAMENQRQELRERLRAQFQNMSVGVHAVSVCQR